MSWNRIYRPRTVSKLHLSSVKKLMTALMASGSFPQTFLFTGPKGTGKTSTARIIGAMLNEEQNKASIQAIFFDKKKSATALQEPNDNDEVLTNIFEGQSYLVQEMDAASNRGIDDIRALKERIQLPPVGGSMSVYILDEVHMLTTEAFNALLKLLEEPPKHVVFILATTELHKVPETVVSRCHVVTFTKASIEELVAVLNDITKQEKLSVKGEVLEFIAEQANGSFRDAIKLLEQAVQTNQLSLDAIKQLLGRNYTSAISELISAVISKDMTQVVELFQTLRASRINEAAFHKDILTYLHEQLLSALGVIEGEKNLSSEISRFLLTQYSDAELSVPTPIPLLRLELKSLDIIQRAQKKTSKPGPTPPASQSAVPRDNSKSIQKTTFAANTATTDNELAKKNVEPIEVIPDSVSTFTSAELSGDGELLFQQWHDFVLNVSKQNFSLATLLKSAHPIGGTIGELTLSVYYKFHQEQLNQPKFQQLLDQFISSTYGSIKINCVLAEHPPEAELREPQLNTQLEKLAVDALM